MDDEHTVSLDLTGKVAIVTGASRMQGIGAAICLAFAGHGADVLFTHWGSYDRAYGNGPDESAPQVLAEKIKQLGRRAHALEIDLAEPDAAQHVIDVTTVTLGRPSILVNNAAFSTTDSFETLDAASLDAHYAVNVRATALLSVTFARSFDAGPGGRIINLTSGQGVTPMPDELSYATTKGAVEAFTTSLAAGVAGKGITVNAIDPGATDTGWMNDDLKVRIAASMATGRVGEPADAARLAVFLASDASAWITGQVIRSRGA